MPSALREPTPRAYDVFHVLHPHVLAPPVALATPCTPCRLFGMCEPCAAPGTHAPARHGQVLARRKVAAGQVLYAQGEAFHFVYAVRSGTLKSSVMMSDGRSQVCAFHMQGEVMGLDAIESGLHASTTTALEDTGVCAVAHEPLMSNRDLQRSLSRLMSQEITRSYRLMMLLGCSSAHERLAAFLLDLSQRYQAQGYSRRDFNLRMTRADVGSYLGMTLETVSRALSFFQQEGEVEVAQRRIRIIDPAAFERRYGALLQV